MKHKNRLKRLESRIRGFEDLRGSGKGKRPTGYRKPGSLKK